MSLFKKKVISTLYILQSFGRLVDFISDMPCKCLLCSRSVFLVLRSSVLGFGWLLFFFVRHI